MRWRRHERDRLIAARLALAPDVRRAHGEAIAAHLDRLLGALAGVTVGVYWPFRGEPNLRRWMEALPARGARCALPVVLARGAPLVFRAWSAGERLVPGLWNIPVPAAGAAVLPAVVIAPLVGFDARCYRLGYGGGYYDRTLAALAAAAAMPHVVGVGFAQAELATIHPLPHDIPMQAIVTELGSRRPRPGA